MTGSTSSTPPLGFLCDVQAAWAAPSPAVNAAQERVEPRLEDMPIPPAADRVHDEPEWKSSGSEAGRQARETVAAILVPGKSTNSALSSGSGAAPEKPAAKAAEPSRPDDSKATKITLRRATPRRSVKDKEIERIKQQAAAELKKRLNTSTPWQP